MNSHTEQFTAMPSASGMTSEQSTAHPQPRYAPPTLTLLSDAARTANGGGANSDGFTLSGS